MVNPDNLIEIGRQSLSSPKKTAERLWSLKLLLLIVITVLAGRSFQLQIMNGQVWRDAAEENRIVGRILPAPRGIIFDANGKQLVANVATTDVLLDPVNIPSQENEGILLDKLPDILKIAPELVQEKLLQTRRSQKPTKLASALDHQTVLELERQLSELPGTSLASSLVRSYPFESQLAHVLGYANSVTSQEIETNKNLLPIDITGKSGLEKFYDDQLRGDHGTSWQEIDARGRDKKQLEERDPAPGLELRTTIDVDLQSFIIEHLESLMADDEQTLTGAAVIVLDPRSGAMRALVSLPSYDPNAFSRPNEVQTAESIISSEDQPLFNRATVGTYPPGSTIKPLLAAGALEENLISSESTILSTGGINVGQWYFPDWKSGGHGPSDVTKAIAESVNSFFYAITGGTPEQAGLGVEKSISYLEKFNWGKLTNIDLPEEATGFLPSPEWKEEKKNEAWYIGDTYHLGIGQGDVLSTPLQIASATAAIANGGTFHQPFLVRHTVNSKQETNEIRHESYTIDISKQSMNIVKSAMRETVNGPTGSGRRLANLPASLAGKTGTAQIGGSEDTHAWFTSFGPYDEPELVVTVLLERGGAGDKAAVPVAEAIWKWWLEHSGS